MTSSVLFAVCVTTCTCILNSPLCRHLYTNTASWKRSDTWQPRILFYRNDMPVLGGISHNSSTTVLNTLESIQIMNRNTSEQGITFKTISNQGTCIHKIGFTCEIPFESLKIQALQVFPTWQEKEKSKSNHVIIAMSKVKSRSNHDIALTLPNRC